MSDISIILGVSGGGRLDPASEAPRALRAQGAAAAGSASSSRPSDRVELSDRARLLSKLAALPEVRQDLIDRAKRSIADGSYETDDVLEQAAAGLAQDLDVMA